MVQKGREEEGRTDAVLDLANFLVLLAPLRLSPRRVRKQLLALVRAPLACVVVKSAHREVEVAERAAREDGG